MPPIERRAAPVLIGIVLVAIVLAAMWALGAPVR